MARSMTGFGRGEASSGKRRFVVEIRTVNHRYCDVTIKTPRSFSSLEERLRKLISQKVNRGKIDVFVSYDESGERECAVAADMGLAAAYIETAGALKSRFNLRDDITLASLLRLPGIFKVDDTAPDEEESWALLENAALLALDALVAMRESEGEKLIGDVAQKINQLEGLLDSVEERAPFVVDDYRNRLNARIADLLGANIPDENRIAAEVAIFADKCSIDEEITRFKSHLAQAGAACVSAEPIGRKFDFILQEINRETNTIGSKANDLLIGENVVEMKTCVEKIREQIQNLE